MKAPAATKAQSHDSVLKVRSCPQVSKQDEVAICKLYQMLVAKWFYPIGEVDIGLIAQKGIPAFEKAVGKKEFMKVRRYFGIGVKPARNIKERDVRNIVDQLRTVENAQYYICGFDELIEQCSKKLTHVPEGMSVLERAKLIRLYETVFVNYYYFIEDYILIKNARDDSIENCVVDRNKIPETNAREFYPEELLYIYTHSLCHQPDDTVIYECVMHELELVRDRSSQLYKDLMRLAELSVTENGELKSVNVPSEYNTLGKVRNLKLKVHVEPGFYPINAFSASNLIQAKFDFEILYFIYKSLKDFKLEDYPSETKEYDTIEGSRVVEKSWKRYLLPGGLVISGPNEASRFITMIEAICKLNYTLIFSSDDIKLINSATYFAAVKFLKDGGYTSSKTEAKSDILMADKLVSVDTNGVLISFLNEEISVEEVKEQLGIDESFEEKVLGLVKETTPIDALVDFAVKRKYLESADDADLELLENVILRNFEAEAKKLASGEMKMAKFEKAIGLTPEIASRFAEMFFDRRKIECSEIELKLEEVKKNKSELPKYKLLIMLYCYVIENHIKCGQLYYKEKPSLKLSMLKKHAKLS